MNKPDKQTEYLKKWQQVRLSETSRERMKQSLSDYAVFHGAKEAVRVPADSRSITQVPTRTAFITRLTNSKFFMSTTVGVLIAVLLGGGTTFAAEGAAPGDLLYPVKTEVNENIKSAFAVGAESEARLQARLTEERLEEAAELEAEGHLDAEAKAELRERITAHLEAAAENSQEAQMQGASEVAGEVRASLEATARAHANALERLNINLFGSSTMTSEADTEAAGKGSVRIDTPENASADVEVGSDTGARINVTAGESGRLLDITVGGQSEPGATVEVDGAAESRGSAETEAGASGSRDTETAGETEADGDSDGNAEVDIGADLDTDATVETNGTETSVDSTTSVEGSAGVDLY